MSTEAGESIQMPEYVGVAPRKPFWRFGVYLQSDRNNMVNFQKGVT